MPKKSPGFLCAFILIILATAILAGCQTSPPQAAGAKTILLFSAAKGAGGRVANIDDYGSGTSLDKAYRKDRLYKTCIAASSPESSYGGTPYCMVNLNLGSAIDVRGLSAFVFKLRPEGYSSFSLIINNQKGYPKYSLSTYSTALKDGWVQVRLPLDTLQGPGMPGSITQLLLAFEGKGKAVLTDLGFERD